MDSPQRKGRRQLILILLVFAVPVIAAKIILELNFYQGGSTNQGKLITPETNYQSFAVTNPQQGVWQLFYIVPKHCNQQCQTNLYVIKQSHTALGPYQSRVKPTLLLTQSSDPAVNDLEQWLFGYASNDLVEFVGQQIVIVDPLGQLVMRYQLEQEHQQAILQGKAILSDLRKLLKLSRVG